MKNLRVLLRYLGPYRWSAVRNIFYNFMSALFALLSFTLVIPFLKILFNRVETMSHPGDFEMSVSYFSDFRLYKY
jgi:hypothetical protein